MIFFNISLVQFFKRKIFKMTQMVKNKDVLQFDFMFTSEKYLKDRRNWFDWPQSGFTVIFEY